MNNSSLALNSEAEVPIPNITTLDGIWAVWLNECDYEEKLKQHMKQNRLKMQKINAALLSMLQNRGIKRLPFYLSEDIKMNLQNSKIGRCSGAFLSKTTRFPDITQKQLLVSCKKHIPTVIQSFLNNSQYQLAGADLDALGEEFATHIWNDRESKSKYTVKPIIRSDKKPSKKRRKNNIDDNDDDNDADPDEKL